MSVETSSSRQPAVVLRPAEADRVVAGHPWVYERGIQKVQGEPGNGDVVTVLDPRRRFLGMGFFNARSRLRIRVISHRNAPIDAAFFEQRLGEALALRERRFPDSRSFRLVNAEGDFLSGLIVDKYEDVLVVQISSAGMEQRKQLIFDALEKIVSPRAIVERGDIASRQFEGLPELAGIARGECADEIAFELDGLRLLATPFSGQKTGFYLDQRTNHRLVAEEVARRPGARVLDCFSSTGAFALHAARAGAGSVHGLDQSREALMTARRLADENGVGDRCVFEEANVFDWLKAHSAPGGDDPAPGQFDAVILDPPSFTRNRASVPNALRGYKEIHVRALKLLAPGGLLATFCCSHHVDAGMFQDVILSAAFDVRRVLRRVAVCSQSLDHPVIPSIPETEYLKGFLFEVVR
ncbi:MAG: class I SAM-dependent rRNA methyltransferase, partial [Verrucomicrobiae bacterium]|nr:class I SAM-dependent rRNA methyltransferase [Verrucomicrobiae bacterium]